MFDIKELEAEVDQEVALEVLEAAKEKLKSKRRQIGQAKAVVRNLEREYQALLLEVTDDAAG